MPATVGEDAFSAVTVSEAFPGLPESELQNARTEVAARTLEYPFGSGEAEIIALFAGLKPMVRQTLGSQALGRMRAWLRQMGTTAEIATRAPWATPGTSVLYASRESRFVHEAIAREEAGGSDLELGRLLGYPRCCVEAYVSFPFPRTNAMVFAAAARRSGEAPHPRLNGLDLAMFHYVPWFPCSFACAPSAGYADAIAEQVLRRKAHVVPGMASSSRCPPGCRHETFIRQIDARLAAHRLFIREDIQISIDGLFDGQRVHVDRAWPTACDRHPDVALTPEASEATARLLVALRRAKFVAVEDGALRLDEQVVFEGENVFLVPFGRRTVHGATREQGPRSVV